MCFSEAIDTISKKIKEAKSNKEKLIIAIDGRCASGKTTLANELCELLDCNVIHTDDFYLQPFQRTEERYLEPGGNLDRERLLKEVLIPLSEKCSPLYIPFDCKAMRFGNKIQLPEKDIYIIEGSYSCHPALRSFYDITVFVNADNETQKERILKRNGEERLTDFLTKWIPLEEKYFEMFCVESKADIVIKT